VLEGQFLESAIVYPSANCKTLGQIKVFEENSSSFWRKAHFLPHCMLKIIALNKYQAGNFIFEFTKPSL